MLTTLKSIALMIDETQYASRIGIQAAEIARDHGAHLIGVYYVSPSSEHVKSSYARGKQAIADLIEQVKREHEEKALAASRHLEQLGHRYDVSIEFRVVWGSREVQENAIAHALHSDLVITGHPFGEPSLTEERLLRATGTPILITPENWAGPHTGRRIVLAWNGSREARRAIGDAMPFVQTAEWVKILIVDADRDTGRHGTDPGVDLARYLVRHNARVEVESVSSGDSTVAETIASYAVQTGADLLVIGAYSHARTAQLLFGGVTRTLLSSISLPLLVSQ